MKLRSEGGLPSAGAAAAQHAGSGGSDPGLGAAAAAAAALAKAAAGAAVAENQTQPAAQRAASPEGVDAKLAARALACLAQRDYSRPELRRKLVAHVRRESALARGTLDSCDESTNAERQPNSAADSSAAFTRIDTLLDWLESRKHLSQQRFAESRLRSLSPRFGNQRIRQELAQHAVTLSPETQASLRESEFERAYTVWRRKFAGRSTTQSSAIAETSRQARFLAGRGFSGEVVRRVLRAARNDACEESAAAGPQAGWDEESSEPKLDGGKVFDLGAMRKQSRLARSR